MHAALSASALGLVLALAPFHDRASVAGENTASASGARTAAMSAQEQRALDGPITPWQSELLDVARRAAQALPTHPHAKTRARLQEEALDAALALDQVSAARSSADGIDNWRRAVGLAKLALHAAEHGRSADALRDADRAHAAMRAAVAGGGTRYESLQDWMGERVDATLARVHLALGQDDEADRLTQALGPAELEAVASARAARVDGDEFDAHLASLEVDLSSGALDSVRRALAAASQLYDRFHDQPERRDRVAAALEAAAPTAPLDVHVRLLARLAEIDLAHADAERATAHLARARAVLDAGSLRERDRLPLGALLARTRHQAGERAEALADLEVALAAFDAARERTPDVFRARALRPAAETFHAMGERERARATYLTALDEGARNPNARPRAEDLVATCCSLATSGFEADATVRERVLAIVEGLREPW